jgi:hypothetical protein
LSGNCQSRTKVKNPGFATLAFREKRGVNSSPAESISFRTGQNHSEKGSSPVMREDEEFARKLARRYQGGWAF